MSILKAISLNVILAGVTVLSAQPLPKGRRIRDIIADKFSDGSLIMGAATGSSAFGSESGTVMDREFSYVTPENDFKHRIAHPDPDTWNWGPADAWLQHISDHDQILRMHGPVSPQCSMWSRDDGRTGEELETDLRLWMRALCQRYNGVERIKYLDVINEVVNNGAWHTDKPGEDWECPWYKIGLDTDGNGTPLFIKYAFEEATAHAPDIKLIINQHGDLSNFDLIKTLVPYLRNQGLRVDGIGWQAHIRSGVSWGTEQDLDALRALVDWCHGNALEFHITEMDVWITSESEFEGQADVYRSILEVLLERRFNGQVGWNAWNIFDAGSWQAASLPTMFAGDLSAKPAYYAVQEALENASALPAEYPVPGSEVFDVSIDDILPTQAGVSITYILPDDRGVSIRVCGILGNELATLADEYQSQGHHRVFWDFRSSAGLKVSPGRYFLTAESGGTFRILPVSVPD